MAERAISERHPPVIHHLVIPILIKPIVQKIERIDQQSAQVLRTAIANAENTCPGLMLDIILSMLRRIDSQVDVAKALLKIQGNSPEQEEYRIKREEEPFQSLNKKAIALKRILSRIPDEINHRPTFLETLREIASVIKKLLDCVTDILENASDSTKKQLALDARRRDFVMCSKKFSVTLKEYFKNGQSSAVYMDAAHLIHQTNLIRMTVINMYDT